MKKQILTTSFIFLGLSAPSYACDIFQSVSITQNGKTQLLGNAYAHPAGVIVVNDHSLAANTKVVQLSQGNKTWTAEIVKRDFHTDLAILRIPNQKFTSCESVSQVAEVLTVMGYDQKDSSLSKTNANLKNQKSTKLMVPGFRESIEFTAAGNSQLQSSQSGSLLLSDNRVAGLVTQVTRQGTALAIKSQDVDQTVKLMLGNQLPTRPYEVDREAGTIHFKGLKIHKQGTGGVDPHGYKPDPKNIFTNDKNAPSPIALEDYNVGAALATVEDFNLLEKSQPNLAAALRQAQVSRVFISSVDGQSVKSTFELLRALGDCSHCVIDSFWIEVKNPEQVQNSTLKLMGWLSLLITELEKDNSISAINPIVQDIQKINPLLAKVIQGGQEGRLDPQIKSQIRNQWRKIDDALTSLRHSDRTLDVINEIRKDVE